MQEKSTKIMASSGSKWIELQETRPLLINTYRMHASKREVRPARRYGNFPI